MSRDNRQYVTLRRVVKKQRTARGKPLYKFQRLELTIPSQFKKVVEPFINKNLNVQAKRTANTLMVMAKIANNNPS